MTAFPAHEAAWHIIEAGASRQSETFYPWYTFYACLFRDWFPYLRDQVIQNSYTYNPQVNKEPVIGNWQFHGNICVEQSISGYRLCFDTPNPGAHEGDEFFSLLLKTKNKVLKRNNI